MMKQLLTVILLSFCITANAKEPERHYQELFCKDKGDTEVVLSDNSRVDCLTSTEAIEVDFSYKWAESIGQSLLYSRLTNKSPAILLIVNEKSHNHLERFHNASDGLGIRLYTIEE